MYKKELWEKFYSKFIGTARRDILDKAFDFLWLHLGQEERCGCACHINLLKKPYEHDSKCCGKMNGYVVSHQTERKLPQKIELEEFERAIKNGTKLTLIVSRFNQLLDFLTPPTKPVEEILGKKSVIDYENNYSHYHCWNQKQPSACGIPLEKHTQCCLCPTPKPVEETPKSKHDWVEELLKVKLPPSQYAAVSFITGCALDAQKQRMIKLVEEKTAAWVNAFHYDKWYQDKIREFSKFLLHSLTDSEE